MKREIIYNVKNLHCGGCAAKIEDAVGSLPYVENANLNFMKKTLLIELKEIKENLLEELNKLADNLEPGTVIEEILTKRNTKVTYNVENLHCAGCSSKVENAINELPHVSEATLNFMKKTLVVEFSGERDEFLEEIRILADKIEPGTAILEVEEEDFTEEYVESKKVLTSDKGMTYKEEVGVGIALFLFLLGTFGIEDSTLKLAVLVLAYIVSGGEVVLRSFKNIARGNIFDENFLMTIATFGAFFVGEHSEAVGVMLFYQIGEYFQGRAVNNSRKSIEGLMDIRPDFANIKIGNEVKKVRPESVKVEAVIVVKPGEKIPLDGVIISGKAALDTSALTGEALPVDVKSGDNVLSGSINKNGVIEVEVKKDFYHSTVNKILELVENASNKKAETEKFITKFAKYYTPAVVSVAAVTVIIPPLFGGDFNTWLYRALIFLVISCPCALIISIPLGFFSGIGAASKKGILIKGGNHLEALNKVHAVVFDKTGTITKGNFKVTEVAANEISKEELLYISAYGEAYSNHPIAKSIVKSYGKEIQIEKVKDYKEIEGYGVSLTLEDKKILLGNHKLMETNKIDCPKTDKIGTIVYLAVENEFKGYLVISDELKADSKKAISSIRDLGIKTYMLTGDNESVAADIADKVGIDKVYAGLLPDQKVEIFEKIQSEVHGNVIFVGDGINDAPVLARADVGVAMGGIGSDAAIEAADVVIMTDELTKIVDGIVVAKATRKIVTQNIILVLVIKLVVMGLGLMGEATMWEAIFADVGVAILAIFNSIRILKK
ncbi:MULTISPECIES: heavy metal translocating P-type ATPase [Psychrilyobacter]|uniref:Cadmium-translocating P-type ATPase n=1 Tax=Psychrilyobacter piezotolerans TaxID=2293438 RepID=A0ABX9KF00_9FUSO|nr:MULTISPECIES: heavy metal translocating P-type ATPase [Psychrilyobacter]MCS5421307.1 heavy metal translocating P-type ATPase [Psychrilyobacter sp. S5]NDI78329.1 cadmium-translocating P-type ATPase [Psychrilyobacter piezotolerans]RDE59676.1 cadmium-translocating P-type ATPase [Psychrilyobacter sp. S5]REI40052.1 cadmium-translocating P-type ATPase [Psychrilyobacter piezotolerans]